MSKYGEPKEEYANVSLYLPARLIEALDYISKRDSIHNRSKIVEIILKKRF